MLENASLPFFPLHNKTRCLNHCDAIVTCSTQYVQNRYIWLPLLHFYPPTEGFPGTISVKLCMEVSGWLRYKTM